MLASVSEIVTCEVTLSGTPGEIIRVGTVELASALSLVVIEDVDSDSLLETSGVVWGTIRLVSAEWVFKEIVVFGSPAETVRVKTAEFASISVCVAHEAVVSCSCGKSVRIGKIVLVFALELVSSEVITPDTSGETAVVRISKLASAPGLVAVENVLSDSLWEKFVVVLETSVLVLAECTHKAVVSVSPGEIVKDGTMELASVPRKVIHESVVSGLCGESVRVGKVVLISAPELVPSEATSPGTTEETVEGEMAELICTPG